ncbi:MAG: HlyD family efflux transporter periplasmic adaptor subunit [Lachnospiraceae bacterium]|nr:HlyD family efflux transporter periplasmic adaptor subunit [Lachnospiraceae bacterium]
MKNSFRLKKIISTAIASSLVVACIGGLTGCGADDGTGRNMNIELVDPVGVAENCVAAQYRSLYDSKSYSGMVCPAVTEYSFDFSVQFANYESVPGVDVVSGDVLVKGDTENLDNQISDAQKYIAEMETNHADELIDLNKAIAEAESSYNEYKAIVERIENGKPQPSSYADDEAYQEALANWQTQYDDPKWGYRAMDSAMRSAYLDLCQAQLNLKKNQETYDLNHSYQVSSLNTLVENRNDLTLSSEQTGTVVAASYINRGNTISGGAPVVAIGDMNVKEIKCDFINKGIINKALDCYAVINGVRYEVEYQAIDNDEYKRLNEQNGAVYSTFIVNDPDNKVSIGDYAVIIVINDARDDVLCIPKSSIGFDENGNYVYKSDGSAYVMTYIKTGISDGLYTEVLSGLEEGDMIKSSMLVKDGKNEATVSYGSVGVNFSSTGELYYTDKKNVKLEIKYGTVYLDEVCVSQYEQITKGQVLAKVHVVADTIEIARQERLLLRQQEYLQELIDADADRAADNKQNTKQITSTQKNIDELKKVISEMKADASTTEIVSPVDGIITELTSAKVGDLLYSGRVLAVVADESQCFIRVDDDDHRLTYGNEVSVTYIDKNGDKKTAQGMVVSVNNMSLSINLQSNRVLVQIPAADISQMAGSTRNGNGWWGVQTYTVTASIRTMDHVLVVPRSAVTDIDGNTFVTIREANGSVRKVSFVSGGSDGSKYWIAEGLTEGMTVCWE